VRAFQDRVDDPKLLEDIRGFIAQEGRHAAEHQRFFDVLRGQGYAIDPFLSVYEAVCYKFLERLFPPEVRLSTTVACEHFTAMFAERALTQGFLQSEAHPALRDLLLWHAAEEIEHKSVAFDVLRKVAPSYGLRMAGLVIATATLTGFWMAGTLVLLAQEKDASPAELLRHVKAGFERGTLGRGDMPRAFVAYMRPGFHPSDNDNEHLAKSHLAGIDAPAAAAAE
jgi:predicted metal-dependent hydrolase